jgi:hypothetical protein
MPRPRAARTTSARAKRTRIESVKAAETGKHLALQLYPSIIQASET